MRWAHRDDEYDEDCGSYEYEYVEDEDEDEDGEDQYYEYEHYEEYWEDR